jgi:hypothetical protein
VPGSRGAATLAGAGVAGGCAMLTEALTASLRRLLSAYRSVLFPALIGAEFALARGQLQGLSSLTLHPAKPR